MLIFFKNVKKFLGLKNANEAYHALHYADGRVYASSPQMLIWLEGEFGKRGSYDFTTGEKMDVRMPEFLKVIPPVDDGKAYVLLEPTGLMRLHTVLKSIAAMAAKMPEMSSVRLDWEPTVLRIEAKGPTTVISHEVEGLMRNGVLVRSRVNAKLFADMVEYYRQRGTDMRLYAPLRESLQSPLLFAANGTGGVLSQVRDAVIWQN